MPLALILVDALTASYVSRSTLPSLCELARDGYAGELENLYAYRGIEATLFTGLAPAQHGVWGEFRPALRSPEPALDRIACFAIRLGDLLPSDRLRLDVRYVVARLRRPDRLLPTGNLIPAGLLPRFASSVETPIWEHGSLGAMPTLFDDLRAAGMSFENVVYPTVRRDDQVLERVTHRVRQGHLPDFWYVKFSALDALGHRFGPNPTSLAGALRELDEELGAVIATLRSAYSGGGIDIVVLSDHGMSRVDRLIDLRPALAMTGLAPGRDFLHFLDSTTARFWSDDRQTRATLARACAEVPGLRVLDPADRRRLQVPADESTGDVLVALDEGAVIFPDFFRRQAAPAGMHGYARVGTPAGRPFLAAGPAVASLLAGDRRPTHADVWAAMRRRLGLCSREEERIARRHHDREAVCTSSF